MWFVNPTGGEILGRPVYPSLADLPVAPDLVDVFRRPDDLPAVAEEVVARRRQDVLVPARAVVATRRRAAAHDAGLDVVMDRCLKIEHARFHGGLHLAGFDTGVISSRGARPRCVL